MNILRPRASGLYDANAESVPLFDDIDYLLSADDHQRCGEYCPRKDVIVVSIPDEADGGIMQ